MKILTLLCISLVIVLEVTTKNLDSELKVVRDSTSQFESVSSLSKSNTSPVVLQKNKKRHATKEVILYLTPSEIKALESGKGLVSLQSLSEPIDHEQLINQHIKLQKQTEFVKQEFENLKSAIIQQVDEQPNDEHSELASQEALIQKELLSPENQQEFEDQLRQELAVQEQLKLHQYYYELNKANHLKLQPEVNGERNAWFSPNIQIQEGYQVQEPQQEDPIEDRNQLRLKVLSSLPLNDEHSESFLSQAEKPLLQLRYSPKYNDQEKAIEIEKILRTHHRHELEKQSAVSQAEQIANSPAILLHEQVKLIKQRPVPVVKHVKVPIPPELGSVPVPVPIEVPHAYAVPQEIIKHISVPIAELERLGPYNEGIPSSLPFNKILVVYVDRSHVDH